jgi:Uncharacterized protein conserved in bacteria (DUF2087)
MGLTNELAELATLVLKSGVGIGGLSQGQRDLALAVPALALPLGQVADEAQVNQLLKHSLAAQAAFLDTDHVELRRWLVDAGWWRRDGYGRAYERTPLKDLPEPLSRLTQALNGIDWPAWVAARREQERVRREARRAAWAGDAQGHRHV